MLNQFVKLLSLQNKPIIPLIFLIILAYIANVTKLPFFPGVNFLFGSIFVLIVVRYYGVLWGVFAAMIASSYTVILWHYPFIMITLMCEALFVGYFMHYKKKNMLFTDVAFWVFIGAPIIWISYTALIDFGIEFALLKMIKTTVNGIFNTIIAFLFITFLPIKKWLRQSDDQKAVPLSQIFYNILALLLLVTSLLFTYITSWLDIHKIEDTIVYQLEDETKYISYQLLNGEIDYYSDVNSISHMLEEAVSNNLTVTILDEKETVIANNDSDASTIHKLSNDKEWKIKPIDKTTSQLVPIKSNSTNIERWLASTYIKQVPIGNNMILLVEMAAKHYEKNLKEYFMIHFMIMLLLSSLTFIIGAGLARYFTSIINSLSSITASLPGKILNPTTISWPKGLSREINSLINSINEMYEEIKEAQSKLHYLAHYDALTNLPNRSMFKSRFSQSLALADEQNKKLAVLFIDLDGFKYINDTHGHESGDFVLKTVAERLGDCINEEETAARQSGDEFVILLPDILNDKYVIHIAKKIMDKLSLPFTVKNEEVFITASIGISLYPNNGSDLDTLIRQADTAMYHVKKKGKNNFHFYAS
jgi:diguanylate cyclase (GGDEF)-like protein